MQKLLFSILNKNFIFVGILLSFLSIANFSFGNSNCLTVVTGSFDRNSLSIKNDNSFNIQSLPDFGYAMSTGMLLHPQQSDLFEIYRMIFFGDPKVSVDGRTLESVFDILNKHPELQKPHYREYNISKVKSIYPTPPVLENYVRSQSQSAGKVRNPLLQVDANRNFWKKLLDYSDPPMPNDLLDMRAKLNKDSSTSEKEAYRNKLKAYQEAIDLRFKRYLTRLISVANRTLLKDLNSSESDNRDKVKALFQTLKRIADWMSKNGKNTKLIRQAMVNLVHTVGFGNPVTQQMLKSSDGLERIEGLRRLLSEREMVADELNYVGHFEELKSTLGIEFPTGLSRNEDPSKIIDQLEREVLKLEPIDEATSETLRVRSLSLQEAPFRSCLGTDCSTRTYFDKALDPNYQYFTLTNSAHHSDGQITVVLGTATNSKTGAQQNVAFVDKIQNISNDNLPAMLTAMSMSLKEAGYILVLPQVVEYPDEVHGHGGISNMDHTKVFVRDQILPKLSEQLGTFTPHPNNYNFQTRWTRAYKQLDVVVYNPVILDESIKIEPGLIYSPTPAPRELNKQTLIQNFLALKDSNDPNDVLKFVQSMTVVDHLEKLGLYSREKFANDIYQIAENTNIDFKVRKAALYSLLLSGNETKALDIEFTVQQLTEIRGEIAQWDESSDQRKKDCFNNFAATVVDKLISWFEENGKDDPKLFEDFLSKHISIKQFFLVSLQKIATTKGKDGRTLLHFAILNNYTQLAKYLIEKYPDCIDITDTRDRSPIQLAVSLGNKRIAKLIIKKNPGAIRVQDNRGKTLLHWAIHHYNEEAIKLLIEIDPELIKIQDSNGKTPLHMAVNSNFRLGVKLLIDKDPKSIRIKDKVGRTPLDLAIQSEEPEQLENLEILINKDPEFVKIQDQRGYTLLHRLVISGEANEVKRLIDKVPELKMIQDNRGLIPLDIARIYQPQNYMLILVLATKKVRK